LSVPLLVAELEREGVELWEEGGELRFRAPRGVMTAERRAVLSASKPAAIDYLRQRARPPTLTPQPEARYEPFPLTDLQSAYLVGRSEAFPYGGVACHGYGELAFRQLDPARLTAAWQTLVERHDMLRAVIGADGRQRVQPTVPEYRIDTIDLRGADPERAELAIRALRDEMSHRVYRTDVWPLFDLRASLRDDAALLHLSIDFLIADLVSTQLLFAELHRLLEGPQDPLPPLDVTFRDYVLAERAAADPRRLERDRDYWLARIDELPPAPVLPMTRTAADRPPRFRRRQMRLAPAEWAKLRSRAGGNGVTPSVALLSAYAEVIGRWSRRPRFTLNLTLQNRQTLHPQVSRLVGDFSSVALLAVAHDERDRFAARARALQERLWEDLDHRLFSGLDVAREVGRPQGGDVALFPIVFTSAIGVSGPEGGFEGLGDLVYGITQTPQVWIDCQALEAGTTLVVNWDVREGVVQEPVVDDMFAAFEELVRRLAADGDAWELAAPVPLPASQRETRRRANATTGPLHDGLLHEPVVAQALATPDRVAAVAGGRSLSYGELLERSAGVAEALHRAGCGPGDTVAIAMDRGLDQVTAVLGTLLTGAAYVPIDSAQPPERRDRMLASARAGAVLTQSWLVGIQRCPPGVDLVAVDELGPGPWPETTRPVGPDELAYVIFTSGSTGAPKGVTITHRAALNTVLDVNRRFHVGPGDRVLALSNLGFDLSVYDVFGPLAEGGAVVLPEHDRRPDPSHWAEAIVEHGVTVWNSVPAQMQMLHDYLVAGPCGAPQPESLPLRLALLSGDWIPVALPDRIRRLLPALRLVSLGGATEASIWSVFHPIGEVPPESLSIPYGKPLTNQTAHVLDGSLRPCPDYVDGELYIGGAGLARGYLGDDALTARRFTRHPATGDRLYRTGDLGRYLPDGSIELLGREDGQVKVRGHRIEVGEVEASLRSHPAVGAAAVVAEGEPTLERRLVAFAETAGVEPAPDAERARSELVEAAEAACTEVTAGVDRERYARYAERLDEAALLSMLRALRELGTAGVAPRYRRLVGRWLHALEERGLVQRDRTASLDRGGEVVDEARLEQTWSDVQRLAEGVEDRRLMEYFRTSALRLPQLVGGSEDPVELLLRAAPAGASELPYRRSLPTRAATRILTALVRRIAERWAGPGPLRVLEVGSAGGGAGLDLAPALTGLDVEYLFTNASPFVVDEARERLGDCRFVRFEVLDPEGERLTRRLSANSFQVVLAADSLHAESDVSRALARLRELASSGGWLLFSEVTRDHPVIMASLELLLRPGGEDGDFADARRGSDRTFLSTAEWLAAMTEIGGTEVLCLPESDDIVSASGMRVFAARVKADRARVAAADLRAHLAERLPDYMVPAQIEVVDALPLTPNAKVDRELLGAWARRPRGDPGAVRPRAGGDGLEQTLAALWAELLGVESVGSEQSFFELGGDSLLAGRVAGRLPEVVPELASGPFDELLRHVLTQPTVAELAAALRADAGGSHESTPDGVSCTPVHLGPPDTGRVRALVHDGCGPLDVHEPLVAGLAEHGPLVSFVVEDADGYLALDPERLIEPAADARARVLLAAGCTDVHVVGVGLGCALALELARQLADAGIEVEALTLVDEPAPDEPSEPHPEDVGAARLRAHTQRALALYRPAPYAGDITVVRPRDGRPPNRSTGPWADACLGDVQVVDVPAEDPAAVVDAVAACPA
jgi:pyochelin synthetase